MNITKCSNCSLTNFATAVACKRCGLPLDSATPSEWDASRPADPQPTSQFAEGQSPYWDQPSYRPSYVPLPAPSTSIVPKIVKLLVGFAVGFLVAFVAVPALLSLRKTDVTKLTWSDYQSADGKFSASFPVTPKPKTMAQPTALGNLQVTVLEADVNKEGGCMLMYADYPVERINMSEETLYDLAVQRVAAQQKNLAISARRYITLDSYRGLEVELKPLDGKLAMSALARIFWVTPRLYVVMGGGPDTADYKGLQKRCLDSFKIARR